MPACRRNRPRWRDRAPTSIPAHRPGIIIDRKAISDAAAGKTIAATSKSCQVLTDRVRRCGELRAELAGPQLPLFKQAIELVPNELGGFQTPLKNSVIAVPPIKNSGSGASDRFILPRPPANAVLEIP